MVPRNIIKRKERNYRKKRKFNRLSRDGKNKHWANHTGIFRDEEFRKGPKYWHGQKPIRNFNPIKNHKDLMCALNLISTGGKNHDHYRNISGLYRERLRTAQSLRDRNANVNINYIAKAGYFELNRMVA